MTTRTSLLLVATMIAALPSASADDPANDGGPDWRNAAVMFAQGRGAFRFDNFGNEDFWGGALRLHEAIAGAANGGVGAGLSSASRSTRTCCRTRSGPRSSAAKST